MVLDEFFTAKVRRPTITFSESQKHAIKNTCENLFLNSCIPCIFRLLFRTLAKEVACNVRFQ